MTNDPNSNSLASGNLDGRRLKQLRLARGLSLEKMAAAMGGIVTKQALSKYELGKDIPSARVLANLAAALNVKAAHLLSQPSIDVQFVAYRKRAHLGKRALEQLESQIRQMLEERVRLQRLLQPEIGADLHVHGFHINSPEQTERAAEELRNHWNLGRDPLTSVVAVLEDHNIHVIEMDAANVADDFDGLSAYVQEDGHILAAAVVARKGASGERQRFSLCHELGHLILNVHDMQNATSAETAAHRFAGAFLAPAVTIKRAIGDRRMFIQLEELLLLKQRFGMSIQAMLYRLRDLHIITESHYKQWCVDISQRGWRTHEPQPLPPEQPIWLRQHVLHAFAEEAISRAEAADLLGAEVDSKPPLGLIERRAFMKLPIAERRRVLAEQAEKAAALYQADQEWQGGDIVEY